MASAVRQGRVTATDCVQQALSRIERDDRTLGSVVALRPEAALAEAAAAGHRGPLAGVPVLIKDLEDVAGLPTRKGSLLLADTRPATADGLVTARLRAAGAIVVGKTALPEYAIEGYTASLATGVTRNPWQPEWSPGGSSGGSAAAMAAGLVPFATATDGGGSVRIPAACCGLLGLKPTNGVIARRPVPDWIDLSTDGVFASTVDDLRLLLDVLAGPVAGDATALPYPLRPVAAPTGLYAAERTSDLGPLPADVAAAFRAAVEALCGVLGCRPRWLAPGALFAGGDPDLDWFVLAAAEHVAALGRAEVEAGLDRMHPATRQFLGDGLRVGIDDYLAARRRRFDYVRALDDLLTGGAVLATPTLAVAGILADGRLAPDRPIGLLPPEVYSTAVQNMTGHPAISLPAGQLPNGLPFGVQLTAARFADLGLVDVAGRWERALPWPLTAPGYEPFTSWL